MERYQDINARTVDTWNAQGWEWGRAIDHQTYRDAQHDHWQVLLTPTVPVPRDWIGDLGGKRVLGLASGGGQQMPIFAARGAICTVVDLASTQIASERMVAEREGYHIELYQVDMTEPLPFGDGVFDLVFHPVSNCYVERVEPIFAECYRVLAPGGVLLSGLDIGINYILDEDEEKVVNELPFNPLTNPAHLELLRASDDGIQFSHTVAEQIGGQLWAGFTLTGIYDDTNGSGRLHELNIPSFIATRAVKPA